jgi:hypothetical protein
MACVEAVAFMWVFGAKRAWLELHKGCDIRIPKIYMYIMKYVTPVFIFAILIVWSFQEGWAKLTMASVSCADKPYIWATRFCMMLIIGAFVFLVWNRFDIDTSGLILLVCSWTMAIGLVIYSAGKMLMIPPREDDRFIEDHEK